MNRRRSVVLVVLLIVVFFGGLYYLLLLAYQADNYPVNSSQSTSRFGVRGLHESLADLEQLQVRRNFSDLTELSNGRSETVFLLGVVKDQVDETLGRVLRKLLEDGDRIVLGINPPAKVNDGKLNLKSIIASPPILKYDSIDSSYNDALAGVEVSGPENPDSLQQAERTATSPLRSSHLPVRAHVKLQLPDDWDVHYTLDDQPMFAEKPVADGRLLIFSGSYAFSNHALRDHRVSELFTYCIGANSHVVFDETHLGLRDQPGVMTLAREYGLTMFFVALIGLGGMYVWKNSSPLVPPHENRSWQPDEEAMEGRGARTGLKNLIRSRISEKQLLSTCLEEYRKDVEKGWIRAEELDQAEQIVKLAEERGAEHLLDAYREAYHVLHSDPYSHAEND